MTRDDMEQLKTLLEQADEVMLLSDGRIIAAQSPGLLAAAVKDWLWHNPPPKQKPVKPVYPWRLKKSTKNPQAWDVFVGDELIGTTYRVYRGGFLGHTWCDWDDAGVTSAYERRSIGHTRDVAAGHLYKKHFGRDWRLDTSVE